MAKKVKTIIKLQIPAGQANPAPPVGPALGQHGINIMGFCKEYNERTASQAGSIVTFITKTPPTTDLLRKALDIEKGSSTTGHEAAGILPRDKLREIAGLKAKDLNAKNVEAAERIIEGTARSMGIKVE